MSSARVHVYLIISLSFFVKVHHDGKVSQSDSDEEHFSIKKFIKPKTKETESISKKNTVAPKCDTSTGEFKSTTYGRWSGKIIVLALRSTHLQECAEGTQDGSSNPHWVLYTGGATTLITSWMVTTPSIQS